ncbi:MAG: universal stress protein, partial [Chitinophagaceae bacterium]|nr:universal stress protein [Rubrivivax sp.]
MESGRGWKTPARKISRRVKKEAGVRSILRHREGHRTGRIGWLRAAVLGAKIVMGTQGLGGLRKWLLGSTTERLLRRTHVPVLAVPFGEESGVPPVNEKLEITRILAATDFSDSSVAAVKYAGELARRFS